MVAGGAVTFGATLGGSLSTAGDVDTSNSDVTFTNAVTLTGNVDVDSGAGAGNVLFSSTIATGGNDLALDGGATGNVTLGDALTGGGDLTVRDGATQSYQAVTADSVDILSSSTLVTFNDTVTVSANNAPGTNALKTNAAGTVTIDGSIVATAATGLNVDIDPVDVNVNANMTATGGIDITASNDVTIAAVTVQADTDATGGGTLNITADDATDADGAGDLSANTASTLRGHTVNLDGFNVTTGIVTADTGNATITANNEITLNAAVTATTAQAVVTAAADDVNIGADVSAGTNVDIDATTGSVLQTAGDVTAGGSVAIDAGTTVDLDGTIGTGTAIGTTVTIGGNVTPSTVTIDGDVTADGAVTVDSTGSVDIGGTASTDITTSADDISVTAGTTLTQTAGTIDSNGGAVSFDAGTDATVDGSTLTGGGTASITADNDISFGAASSVDTETGSTAVVTVTADNDTAAGGGISMTDGAVIDAWGGNLNVSATDDIAIALLRSSATTTVNSTSGAITDSDAGAGADINRDGSVVLLASGNIGTSADPLETTSDNLEAASTSGSIVIDNTGDLEIGNIGATTGVSTGNALIDISAASTITVSEAMSSGGGNVSLDATDDIIVNADVTSGGGTITLRSDSENGGDGGIEVTATVNSGGGSLTLGGGADASADSAEGTAATGNHGVNLAGGTLTAGAGNISVRGSSSLEDGVRIDDGDVQTTTGMITIVGSGVDDGVEIDDSGVSTVTSTSGNISITGTSSGENGILIEDGADVTTGGSGTITLDGTATGNDFDDNAVLIQDSGTIVETADGLLTITGDAQGDGGDGAEIFDEAIVRATGTGGVTINGMSASDDEDGVKIDGGTVSSDSGTIDVDGSSNNTGVEVDSEFSGVVSQITSTSGAIEIDGTGGTTDGANHGINLADGADIVSLGAATITLTGTGGNGTTLNMGVLIEDAGTTVDSVDGDIQITGFGGDGSADINIGASVFDGALVRSTGNATITIEGTGGDGTDNNIGVAIEESSALVTSVTGAIEITGVGGQGTAGNNEGVLIGNTAVVSSTGAATITIMGTGDDGTNGGSGDGVEIDGNNAAGSANVTTVTGNIELIGTSATSDGVVVVDGALVQSTGAGQVTVDGTSTADDAVVVLGATTLITSATGAIDIDGDATGGGRIGLNLQDGATVSSTGTGATAATITIDGLGGTSDGVFTSGSGTTISSIDGDIQITGTTASADWGVEIAFGATIQSTGGGADAADITIMGTNTGTGDGVLVANDNTIVTTVDGDIQITGDASAAGADDGVVFDFGGATVSSTGTGAGAGTITIMGTGADGDGVQLTTNGTPPTVTSVDGAIQITGVSGDDDGVELEDGSDVTATGTATITIMGTANGNDVDDNGIVIEDSGTTVSSVNGLIQITGTANGDGGDGVELFNDASISSTGIGGVTIMGTSNSTGSEDGVKIDSGMISTNSGTITITGTNGDDGVEIDDENGSSDPQITSTSGNISITGSTTDDDGVKIEDGADVTTGSTGTISVMGTSTGTGNGVTVTNTGTTIVSANGALSVTGSADGNDGVEIEDSSLVQSTGTTVTVTSNSPILIDDATVSGAGNVTLTANEDAGMVAGDNVTITNNATVTSTGADVTVNAGDNIVLDTGSDITATAAGGDINLNSGVGDNDDIGSQTLDATISANTANGIVTIDLGADTGTGAATDGTAGTITSFELLLLSMNNAAATFTLDNDGHDVDELAANTSGDISFRDDDGLLVDTVGATMGISTGNGIVGPGTGGSVLIDASNAPGGTIEVNQPIDTTPPATGGPGMISLSGAVIVDAMITAEGDDVTLIGSTAATADMIINVGLQSGLALNLTAPRDIIINALVQTTNTGDVSLTADSDNNGTGGVLITDDGQIMSIDNASLLGSDGFNATFLDDMGMAQTGFAAGVQQVQVDSNGAGVVQVTAVNDVTIGRAGTMTPANADTVINGLVQSTGAGSTISIEANEDITFGVNGDVTRTDAGASGLVHILSDQATAASTGGVITMANGAVIDGGGHEVEIIADGTLTIGEITTTDLVNAASIAANIADADAGAGNDITAAALAISAATGVGTDADAIETTLGSLAGRTDSGDLNISNTGNLSLDAVNLTTFVQTLLPTEGTQVIGATIEDTADNNSTGDNLTIVTAGTLFVSGAMDADAGAQQGTGGISNEDGGNIVLTTTGTNDLTISGDVQVNDSDAGEDGDGNIDINSGQDVIVNNDASVNVDNEGQIMIDATRAISISTTNADVTSVDGAIALTANAGGATGNFVGITIDDATVTTSTGAVSLTGTGGTTGDNNHGVEIHNAAFVGTNGAAGTITIMGTGGAGGASNGVLIDDGGTFVDTDGANATISITGTTAGNHGVELSDADVETDGAGATITIMGTTTANTATSDGVNINGANAEVESDAGAISITGTTAGGGTAGDGVEIAAGVTRAIDANGAATILVRGIGDGTDVGVQIDSPIESATGTVTIRSNDGGSANDDITFGAAGDITSTSGTITIDAENAGNTADVFMADGTIINAGTGLIDVDADVNITLGSLVTTMEVQATAVAGSIIDGGDSDSDITAATAALRAALGIGTDADDIDSVSDATTTTLTLAATTDSGDIHVVNTGHLIIGTVNGLVGATIEDTLPVSASNLVENSGLDNITFTTMSPLTVNSPVTNNDGGNITLTAGGTATTDDVNLNANVTLTGADAMVAAPGIIQINAGDSILQAATSDVTSDGAGGLDYNASQGSGAGTITMTDGAEANTGTGEITFDAIGDIQLGGLLTSNATATAVNIDTTTGDIIDGGDTHVEITANAAGSQVILDAANGIGDGTPAGAGADARIETQIAQLDASVTSTGMGVFDINILESDAIDLLDVDTADGSIRIETTNGAILATDVRSDNTDAEANDIVLTSGGANNDINVTLIDSGSTLTTGGDTFLNSAGGIFETSAPNTTNNITADGLRLVTNNGEGVASEVPGGSEATAGEANLLDVTVNSLEANISGGGLFLVNSQALNLEDIDLTGEGDGGTAITSTNSTVRVNTTAGDITVTELVNATGQLATLNAAAGSINDNTLPAIDDLTTPVNDIVSNTLALRAANGVGVMANRLEVDTNTLAYAVGANGILLTDTAGGLTINNVDAITSSSSGGVTEITSADSGLTVAHNVNSTGSIIMTAFDNNATGDDLTVNTQIQVIGAMKITLQAGDDLTLQDRSRVQSGGGAGSTNNVVLNVETTAGSLAPGNADTELVSISTVTLLGSIGSGAADVTVSEVNGGTDGDVLIVYPQNRVLDPTDTNDAINHELLTNLAGGNDRYRVHMNGLFSNSTLNQDVRIEDSTGANDQATVFGTSGGDQTLDVRNLPDSVTGTQGGEIHNSTAGGADERVTYTGSMANGQGNTGVLERLEVNGGERQAVGGALDPIDMPDTFNVQPSNTTQILINGNTPQFGSHNDDFPQTAGDVLNLETFGNRFSIIGKSIFVANGTFANMQYAGIAFRNIETLPLDDPANNAPIGTDTLRFDFNDDGTGGSGASPTQNGYTGILQNTYYGVDEGAGANTAGWVIPDPANPPQTSPVDESDLGAGAFTLADFSDLRRDHHASTGAATFRTDIANGWYLVSVKAGASRDLQIVDAVTGDILSAPQTFNSGGTFTGVVLVQNDTGLQLTFRNAGDSGQEWRVQGLDIRPGQILTIGSPEPGALEANGGTIDFPGDVLAADGVSQVTDIDNDRLGQPDIDLFRGFNATANAIITIRAGIDVNSDDVNDFDLEVLDEDGGTLLDIDPESDGIQVRADGNGVWTYGIRRPFTAGTAFVSFEEFDGAQTGCLAIDYVPPDIRRFDFNTDSSPTQSPILGDLDEVPGSLPDGYIGVIPADQFSNPQLAYGWDGVVGSGDSGTTAGAQGDLIRDAHVAVGGSGTRTFSTEIANGTYVVNVTLGSSQGTTLDLDGVVFDASGLGNRVITRTVTVDDERFDLAITRRDQSTNWIIRGLELIPAAQQAGVTVAGIDFGAGGGVEAPGSGANAIADGVTVDTISGTAAANTVLTVSSSAGTITSVDALASLVGTQIQANGAGAWSFTLQRPSGFAQPLIEVSSVDNSGFFSNNNVVTYNTQGGGRLFDFNTTTATTQAGYVDVQPSQTYDQVVGFGWSTAISDSNDAGAIAMAGDSDLLRDSHGATTDNTFRVDIADGNYEVTVTVAYATDLRIRDAVSGATLQSGIDAQTGEATGRTHHTFIVTAMGGNGIQLQFDSQGNQSLWALNGLAIRDTPNGVVTLLHAGSTDISAASTYGLSGLTTTSIYTVSLSAGSIVNFGGNPDADPAYDGFQVTGTTTGTLNIINPATPGNATLTVEEVSGEADQTDTINYVFPAGNGLRFDFGSRTSAVQAGYTQVDRADLFTADSGFGFTANQPTEFLKTGVNDLRSDGIFVDTHTFRVATGNGIFDARIYSTFLGIQSGSVQVSLEGGAATTVNSPVGTDSTTVLTATVADGFLDISFLAGSGFINERGFVQGIDVATTGDLPGATPLMAATIGSGADSVTQSEVDSIVDAALVRFAAAGVSEAELAHLREVDVRIENIGGAYLGLSGGDTILIDDDAAGNGWFVDQSPLDDSEFDVTDSDTQLSATSGPAAGRTDLLTTVMHELAHSLGYLHDEGDDSLLSEVLETGTRRTEIDGVFSAQDILDELYEVH